MQHINGVPIDKEEGEDLIRVQILLTAVDREEQLPDSVKKSLYGYFDRRGE